MIIKPFISGSIKSLALAISIIGTASVFSIAIASDDILSRDSIRSLAETGMSASDSMFSQSEKEDMQDLVNSALNRANLYNLDADESLSQKSITSRMVQGLKLSQDIMGENVEPAIDAMEGNKGYPGGVDTWIDILISKSLGEDELKDLMYTASISEFPVRLVIRGINDGQKINDVAADISRWIEGLDRIPEAIIDPTIFQSVGSDLVPVMIYMHKDEIVASVTGLSNPEYLRKAVEEQGAKGDLGIKGPTKEVSERDLIEVMQERILEYDFDKRKEETVKTFWQRADMNYLPFAPRNRTRIIDPTVTLSSDMRDEEGRIFVPKGTQFNPLDLVPFNMRLIIFNPNNEFEVQWLKTLDPSSNTVKDIYMFTELERERGWDHYSEIQQFIDEDLFTLTPEVKSRFSIERTPTVVTANETHFIVREVSRDDVKNAVLESEVK